jgi:hypothetical protein
VIITTFYFGTASYPALGGGTARTRPPHPNSMTSAHPQMPDGIASSNPPPPNRTTSTNMDNVFASSIGSMITEGNQMVREGHELLQEVEMDDETAHKKRAHNLMKASIALDLDSDSDNENDSL